MVLQFMKKLDNFTNCLLVLANADFKLAETNDIVWRAQLQDLLVKFFSLVIKLDLSMTLRCGFSC